jgi:hypothetical protein
MNLFDKFCAFFSFLLGVVLLLLGGLGLFKGCHANFALPPVVGVIPAFIGWGIVRPIIVAWRDSGNPYFTVPKPVTPVAGPTAVPSDPGRRPVSELPLLSRRD